MLTKPAILALADGSIFEGISVGASGDGIGELVFNTAMTGYQEILTDPSYAKQIVTLTSAHVGNTGCNIEDMESSRVWAAGLVMRNCTQTPSNYRSQLSLPDFLKKQGIVAIAGIDTRQLTVHLRECGAIAACVSTHVETPQAAIEKAQSFKSLNGLDLAIDVSRQTKETWNEGLGHWGEESRPLQYHVVVYDFGVKNNILRILQDKGCHVTLVPAQTPPEHVLALNPEGILLANGPGDPKACDYAITATKCFLEKKIPILGICLGFQILGLACGGKSLKMKFGHHGANHPVVDVETGQVMITSQNHGFAIDEASLPDCLTVTHRSLFDQSLQGIRHKSGLAIGFQGHPEASPGPHDMDVIFERFIAMMRKNNE